MSFITYYGIEPAILEECHHSITYDTPDVNVPLRPPYFREIWDYKNAYSESTQKMISNFDWSKAYRNKDANQNSKLFTDTLMNLFRNYIPNEITKIDCKTSERTNTLIISTPQKGSILFKSYYRNPFEYNKEILLYLKQINVQNLLERKQLYITKMSSKLGCPDATLNGLDTVERY